MTKEEALAQLRVAYTSLGMVIDSLEECGHPSEMLEPLPTTMGGPTRPVMCGVCGEKLEIPWEETEDGKD